ncbi:MAG TPA: SpoIIE family protein phosphatase, partial [Bosea sp. (in: a-proteobacteria)]
GGAPMGSTLAVLLVHDRHFACVWSGDSRIYLVRAGQITQISRDHTEVQDMVERGVLTPDEAKRSPRRHIITRAIGVHDMPELDLDSGEIASEDVFVLCSDGLTEHVADDEILQAIDDADAQQACDALLALTLQRGARDNVTVIIVRYHQDQTGNTQWMPNMRMQGNDTP